MPSAQSSKYQIFYVPAAILLGSLAIAVAILVTGGLGNKDTSLAADSQQETASVSIDDDPVLGAADAPITIVEFSDYQCPYCQSFQSETLPQIKSEYIDSGLVRFVYRDFPLSSIGHVSERLPRRPTAPRIRGNTGKCTISFLTGSREIGAITSKAKGRTFRLKPRFLSLRNMPRKLG